MTTIKDAILYLPFDEPAESGTAYDYSKSRADGFVNNASFERGKEGNAIRFEGGQATCEVNPTLLYLSGDFTILAWVNPLFAETGQPKKLIWIIPFEEVDDYIEVPFTVPCGSWTAVALVRTGTSFDFYKNGSFIQAEIHEGTPTGASINQDWYGEQGEEQYGQALLDDLKLFNTALSQQELTEQTLNTKEMAYIIDGVDFKDYGVSVSDSSGLLDRPKMKAPLSISWDNYHGVAIDLKHKFYEQREITLECYIMAEGKGDFAVKVNTFQQIFDKLGTHRLVVDIHPTKPLVYEVYSDEAIVTKKTWSDSLMVGTFSLKLKEPSPVKRILKHIRTSEATKTISVTLTSAKLVDVYWGDGSVTTDVSGTNVTITHDYVTDGEYLVLIAGCIDEITNFSTNAIVVWNKL
jgi:hypothetical protein